MSRIEPGSATSEKPDVGGELAWIGPGATFTDDGAPNRITKVETDRVHGVSADDMWCWLWPDFVEAVRAGRIQHAPGIHRRGTQLGRQRLRLGEAAIRSVEDASRHPLVAHYGGNLAPDILRTLQALRIGAPAEPPLLIALLQVAQAGAAAEGLGPSVAWPERKGGRRSSLSGAAQDIQHLLARFQAWVEGRGEFLLGDFKRVGLLVEAGLKATGALQPNAPPETGRPADREALVQRIDFRLTRGRQDCQPGTDPLREAIREAAEQEILHHKRVNAGWAGTDPDSVSLDDGDKPLLQSLRKAIRSAYRSRHAR